MIRFSSALVLFLVSALPLFAQGFDTAARAAWVYDETTSTVLMEKNADEQIPPASMSKLMTIFMAFDAVKNGQLTLEQTLPVSEHAMSYGGSSMYLNTLDRPTVEDLLRGVIVQSGNDASAVLAEALSPDGTEAGFAELMNKRATELGMSQSHFLNSNGWPAEGHVMSARDLGILTERLIEDYPDLYPIFAEEEFRFDGRVPSNWRNRNPILGVVPGADGLKTGHTEEAGYGLVGSAVQDGRRVIFVISGLSSEQARRTEAERITNWAFRQFSVREVGEAGTRIAEAEVWMGAQPRVGLVLPEDLTVLVPVSGRDVQASVSYQGPVAAPIEQGQQIAELVLECKGMPETRLPLVAETDVPQGGFLPRVTTAVQVLLGKAGVGTDVTAPARSDETATMETALTEELADEGSIEDVDPEEGPGEGSSGKALAQGD